jgi:heat shock protein HtpX
MNSTIKTFLLLGGLSLLIITLGGFLGGEQGIITAFMFSMAMNAGAYFFSDKLALMASGAKPLSRTEFPWLYEMVKSMTKKMKIPMPKLFITPDHQANAFATGRDPAHASVAVTRGIIETLSKEELQAVLAHELAHVKNRDILIASIAAVLASTISFMANMALWGGGSQDDEEGNSNAILGIVSALLLPIGASLIQMAISREREYIADATGAEVMGNGEPLAQALLSIHHSTKVNPKQMNPAYASLYISNPFGGHGGGLMNLFSTHPPLNERVKRLRSM